MDAQEGKIPDEEAQFAKLMKRLTGKQASMPDDEGCNVVRPRTGSMSIIEVTEELLRQLKK